jgi:hypothetical protein
LFIKFALQHHKKRRLKKDNPAVPPLIGSQFPHSKIANTIKNNFKNQQFILKPLKNNLELDIFVQNLAKTI